MNNNLTQLDNSQKVTQSNAILEPQPLNSVKEFHTVFNHPVLNTPEIPDVKRCALRVSLIAEELKELEEAIENKDIVEVADAFADLQYVLAGAILEFGLADKFQEIFEEVHRSNMSKACQSAEEATRTLNHHFLKGDRGTINQKENGSFIVIREDGKLLKSVDYSPANLKSIILK